MRKLLLFLFLLIATDSYAQLKVCSWNLRDMGKSKSPESIIQMAEILKGFDVVALQEIVVSDEGAKAVGKLVDALDRTGANWDYCISDATVGSKQKREKYAFLWKSSSVTKVGKAWLDAYFSLEVEREPYLCTFRYRQKDFTLVNFHAITKKLQPETEIKYFKFYPAKYSNLNLVFAGDFNCPQTHTVFNPLKKNGFVPALTNTKTTLRRSCDHGCTASEFDNFFYDSAKANATDRGVIALYEKLATLEKAHELSDHLPIWMVLTLK